MQVFFRYLVGNEFLCYYRGHFRRCGHTRLIGPTGEFVGIILESKRDSVRLACLKLRFSNHHRWSSFLDNGSGCERTRVTCANGVDRGQTIIVYLQYVRGGQKVLETFLVQNWLARRVH